MRLRTFIFIILSITALMGLAADSYAADSGHVALVPYGDDDFGTGFCEGGVDISCRLKTIGYLFYHGKLDSPNTWVHKDIYDAIFYFEASSWAFLQGWTVYHPPNPQKGIGRDYKWDLRSQYGIPNGKLRIMVSMATLSNLPDNPDDKAPKVAWPFFPLTGAETMGHEFGHYWMASITYKKNDVTHCWLRANGCSGDKCYDGFDKCDGYDTEDFNQHWSRYFNSRSVMYGSFIEDLGGGQFKFTYPTVGYSQLDQYLMGLRSAEQVSQELFIVDTSSDNDPVWGSDSIPMQHDAEETLSGKRIDFTMNDIIASVGQRDPERDPCHWKAAFILAYPKNNPPSEYQIKKVDDYRKRWETYYDWATSNKGSFDTTLNGHGPGTPTCPAPNYPDGGYPPDDAGYDGGAQTDSGSSDGGVQDAGKTDGGVKDGSTDSGAKTDGAVNLDSGENDDSGTDEDASEPEDDAGDAGKKKKDGGTATDPAAGCSCSTLGL